VNILLAVALLALILWGANTTMSHYVRSVGSPEAGAAMRREFSTWQFPIIFCIFIAAASIYFAPQYWVPIVAVTGFGSQAILGAIAHKYGAVWLGGRPAMQHVRNSAISFLIIMGMTLYLFVSKYNQGQPLARQVSPSIAIVAALVVVAIAAAFLRTPNK
jgi:hypothetical protein